MEIFGVKIKNLKRHLDERGYLMEILRDDEPNFIKFGQVYLTTCNPNVVKAWHAHKKQIDNFTCIKGIAKIGLYDGRENSPTYKKTQTVILSELEPKILQIPNLVWHGFTPTTAETIYIINIPTEHYDYENPDELRCDPFNNDFGYEWKIKSG